MESKIIRAEEVAKELDVSVSPIAGSFRTACYFFHYSYYHKLTTRRPWEKSCGRFLISC